MRVLCTCVPGYGHLHPMVPLARALQEHGHAVAFATEARFVQRAQQAGFDAFAAGIGPGRVFEEALARWGAEEPGPDDLSLFGARMFAGIAGPAKVSDLAAIAADWQPDLVVTDVTDFAGPIVAARAGIPWATHSLGPAFPPEFMAAAGDLIAPTWSEWGVDPQPLGGMFTHVYLDICPPTFQSADAAGAAPTTQPMRPVPFDAVAGEELPPWVAELPDRLTIYVTLGTLDNDAPGVIEAAVEGLRGQDLNVIVTVGPNRDPQELGPPPDGVHVERYLPQSLLFERCDVVVTHGGSGTTLGALAHGLPMLMIPQGANQFGNAERAAGLGVAIRLLPAEADADRIRDAFGRLVGDPAYRENARRLADEIGAMPPPEALVPELEALAGRGPS